MRFQQSVEEFSQPLNGGDFGRVGAIGGGRQLPKERVVWKKQLMTLKVVVEDVGVGSDPDRILRTW